MATKEDDCLLRFCKALADESRLKIVGLIARGERSVQELAALMGLREPTVSHHLSILKETGLAKMRIEGNTHWYRLDSGVLRKTSRMLFDRDRLAVIAASVDTVGYERKVLAAFVTGERLTKIPDLRRKRWVILKWLTGYLAWGTDYSEAAINSILKVHHEDAATLRREMVGYRMLARDRGRYKLLPPSRWRRIEG
jgi:hypothetical protein